MEKIFGSENFSQSRKNAAVALGNFDGVHLGHQYIISKTIALAKKNGGQSIIYTFDPHPVKILSPESCPRQIQTIDQKLDSLEKLGLDVCIIEKFTHEFARQTPEEFFNHVLLGRLHARAIVVGYDFTFGYHRGGTVEVLEKFGKQHDIEIKIIEARFVDDALLSSTEIRRLIAAGNIEAAAKMLGKPFEIEGKVVSGKGIGGYLGAHTANIESINELLPQDGVYITITNVGGKKWPSITSVGHNPTFPGGPLTIETHLIDFQGNLIDKIVAVDFLKKMRDQIAFPSVEKLHEQILKDVDMARRWHEKNHTL